GVDQGLQRREPDVALLIVECSDQKRLRRGGMLLDQLVDRPLAEVGVARGERRLEELQSLGLLESEREDVAAERRIGIVDELQEEVPAAGLADLGHRLVEQLAPDVRMDAPHRKPEGARAGSDGGKAQRRLERLGPDAGEAVIQGTGQQLEGGLDRRAGRDLSELVDQDLEAAAANILMRGV